MFQVHQQIAQAWNDRITLPLYNAIKVRIIITKLFTLQVVMKFFYFRLPCIFYIFLAL